MEEIKSVKAICVHMGPPKYKLPYNFDEIVKFFHNKAITNTEISKILNMI